MLNLDSGQTVILYLMLIIDNRVIGGLYERRQALNKSSQITERGQEPRGQMSRLNTGQRPMCCLDISSLSYGPDQARPSRDQPQVRCIPLIADYDREADPFADCGAP